MSKITDLHEEVYLYLLQRRNLYAQSNTTFNFTLRIENKGKKLEQGYWFYGGHRDILISFWTGNDWLNETPNIYFRITLEGECSLHLSAGDSNFKSNLFSSIFVRMLNLENTGRDQWSKYYTEDSYEEALYIFLETDRHAIDNLLQSYPVRDRLDPDDNDVEPIVSSVFEQWRALIEGHRRKRGIKEIPYGLLKLRIEQFPPIKKLSILKIPANSPFIFITGDNGTGKTTLLKSIAFALSYTEEDHPYAPNSPWQIKYSFYGPIGTKSDSINFAKGDTLQTENIPFACYGASRLDIHDSAYSREMALDARTGKFHSLFNHNAIFRDINRWLSDSTITDDYNSWTRYESIKKMLIAIIPNVYNISETPWEKAQEILYYELDSNGEQIAEPVQFRSLSSGIKSLIVLLGDMMIRLFEQQPNVADPSELRGIVLIDEIDVHLHPNWQRRLPHILHEYFPYVQFIATTHSPIPLLGAPPNSRIYVSRRDVDKGITLERMDNQIELGNLLPNTILTSPIFGLDKIIPESNKSLIDLSTERTYRQTLINRNMREELRKAAKEIRDEED